jgi:hypothetical protein
MPAGLYKTSLYSGQIFLLPYLEAKTIFTSFGTIVTGTAYLPRDASTKVRMPIFICPSDGPTGYFSPTSGNGSGANFARSNFVLNFGTGNGLDPGAGNDLKLGPFRVDTASSFAAMVDGVSNTVLASEVIAGKAATDRSGAWALGDAGTSGYTHLVGPKNSWVTGDVVGGTATVFTGATANASSNHPGLVDVVYCDAHIASIDTGIDLTQWQAAGTANGGEAYMAPK